MSRVDVEEHHLKAKVCIKYYGERRKMQDQQSPTNQPHNSTPYRSSQARGKAIKRARSSLPASPDKRRCMIESLAKTIGLHFCQYTANSLSEETKQLVLALYNSNDISWQAPGHKDIVIIWVEDNKGKKVKRTEQVFNLLKEAHSKVHLDIEVNVMHKSGKQFKYPGGPIWMRYSIAVKISIHTINRIKVVGNS